MPLVKIKKKVYHKISLKRSKKLPAGTLLLIPSKKHKKKRSKHSKHKKHSERKSLWNII